MAKLDQTTEHFLVCLKSALIQADQADTRRSLKRGMSPNPYALGHLMGAVGRIREETTDIDSFEQSMMRCLNDSPARRKIVKALAKYRETGKLPSLPKNVKGFWS